ncbi:MAG: coenzyme F420 hydrogenase/dehydrogenase beta subunit N-terminal domain-containing protein, partial [Bradyrhizobium sp.]
MAGRERVEMRLTSFGQIRPHTKQHLEQAEMARILAVCPGLHIRGPAPFAAGEAGLLDPDFGPIKSLQRVWAGEEKIRFHAAAGGSLTALGRYLLKSGEVDAVLHVAASKTEPALTDAKISRTPDEVTQGAQSRYGPAAPLVHVKALLEQGLRFAVIAKPCDIAAIR